jgi:hypothetical protein
LFLPAVDDEAISKVVDSSGWDVRLTMNNLQFIYAPIIMRSLLEVDLPENVPGLPSPKVDTPKVDMRSLADLQFELYRSGLMKPKSNENFIDGLGLNFRI